MHVKGSRGQGCTNQNEILQMFSLIVHQVSTEQIYIIDGQMSSKNRIILGLLVLSFLNILYFHKKPDLR